MLTWISKSDKSGYEAVGFGEQSFHIIRSSGRFRLALGSNHDPVGTLKALKVQCEELNELNEVAFQKLGRTSSESLVDLRREKEDDAIAANHKANVVHPIEEMARRITDAAVAAGASIDHTIQDETVFNVPAGKAQDVVTAMMEAAPYVKQTGGQHGPSPLDGTEEEEGADTTYNVMSKTPVIPVPPLRIVTPTPAGKSYLVTATGESPLSMLANRPKDTAPHLIVEARAGTGKTTTLVESLKRLKGTPTPGFVPSPQQAAVFAAVEQSRGLVNSICFVAFNKSIAEELARRVPVGCEASTMHSMGFKAVKGAFHGLRVESNRVGNLIGEVLNADIRDLRRNKPTLVQATEKLVGLCKMNLIGTSPNFIDNPVSGMGWEDELSQLATHYDVELDKSQAEVFALVPQMLERCKDVARDKSLNFDDMIWLPIALNLPITKYDLLLVDEAQDLNRCQQELAKRAGRRLILCGDPKQAIYGFAGADSESMPRLYKELRRNPADDEFINPDRGCTLLPLTVTRRCGKAIVREAQKIVPDFQAFDSNPEGRVAYSRRETEDQQVPVEQIYRSQVQDGDMVLCRVNAPLVKECFRFLKLGCKANIQGRDIGQGLISTLTKLKCFTVLELLPKLSEWLDHETKKELAKKNPSDARVEALNDRYDCLVAFTDGLREVNEVVRKIESVFTDDKSVKGIWLSSGHKAKGLEAKQVFILQGKGCTGRGGRKDKPRKPWEMEQESNLRYVMITRAIESLVFVN